MPTQLPLHHPTDIRTAQEHSADEIDGLLPRHLRTGQYPAHARHLRTPARHRAQSVDLAGFRRPHVAQLPHGDGPGLHQAALPAAG